MTRWKAHDGWSSFSTARPLPAVAVLNCFVDAAEHVPILLPTRSCDMSLPTRPNVVDSFTYCSMGVC